MRPVVEDGGDVAGEEDIDVALDLLLREGHGGNGGDERTEAL